MSTTPSTFEEESAAPAITALPMSHLSVEVGHLYLSDILAGENRLRDLAQRVAPWLATVRQLAAATVERPRVSTCYLIDDYSADELGSPQQILPALVAAARDAGFVIDYLAREAACAVAGEVPLASIVLDHVVADPPPETDGRRPATHASGWLCNGVRSPAAGRGQAFAPEQRWRPPAENGANPHSVFVDVQLWDETATGRRWSCSFLAAVWQLLRLGALRTLGRPVVDVVDWTGPFPPTWAELPALVRLEPRAQPFAAYRAHSIMDSGFLTVEHAVRTILGQVAVEPAITAQVRDRAEREGLLLPPELVDRLTYTFLGDAWRS